MLGCPTLKLHIFYSFYLCAFLELNAMQCAAVKAAGNCWPQWGICIDQVRQQLEKRKYHMNIILEPIKILNVSNLLKKTIEAI